MSQFRSDLRPRRVLLRTAYLLVGAAICLAFLLLQVGIVRVARDELAVPYAVSVPVVAVPALLLGLLPGVRDVEVSAVRALLGVEAELVSPRHVRAEHRRRTTCWVALHVVLGGVSGIGLVLGVPTAFTRLPLPLAVVASAGLVASVVVVGLLLARLAPWFLGPTWRDRSELAEDRLAREVEQQRLARDLHDGVGHALSVISLQAVAGREVISQDADRAANSLQAIETTARRALDELDRTLGRLRDERDTRRPEPDAAAVAALLATHRELGTDVDAHLGVDVELPPLVSRTVYRVVAEGLTNAGRYGGHAPVVLRLTTAGDDRRSEVQIMIGNDLPDRVRSRPGGGRGLIGVRERVALLGGRLTAGVDDDHRWRLYAAIPFETVPVESAPVEPGSLR